MRLEIIRDILGQPYIGIVYSIENRTYKPVLNLVRKLKHYISNENVFIKLVNNQALRDGVMHWHMTVFNSMECKKFPELLELDGMEISESSKFLGVGKILKNENDTYFIVCNNKEISDLYNSKISNSKRFLHITIGFTSKDLFHANKDENTLIFKSDDIFPFENNIINETINTVHLSKEEIDNLFKKF